MASIAVPLERSHAAIGEGSGILPWLELPASFFVDDEPRKSYRYDPEADPHEEVEFLDCLPRNIVWYEIWPKLMNGSNALANFRICTQLRMVCRGWVRDVDGTED
ncbi:hypothetical protein M758_UG291800 [Ceratodon purpureus]|nr:hypothetical protein M758_UG291800 [Ceratodon purpureus]